MKIAFEGLLMLIILASSVFFVGIPLIKLFKLMVPSKKDPVKEAEERLTVARKEAEAARLNKETEKVYSHLYEETLQDDEVEGDKKKL